MTTNDVYLAGALNVVNDVMEKVKLVKHEIKLLESERKSDLRDGLLAGYRATYNNLISILEKYDRFVKDGIEQLEKGDN